MLCFRFIFPGAGGSMSRRSGYDVKARRIHPGVIGRDVPGMSFVVYCRIYIFKKEVVWYRLQINRYKLHTFLPHAPIAFPVYNW